MTCHCEDCSQALMAALKQMVSGSMPSPCMLDLHGELTAPKSSRLPKPRLPKPLEPQRPQIGYRDPS